MSRFVGLVCNPSSLRFCFAVAIVFLGFTANPQNKPALAYFTDVAEKSGITMTNVFGGIDTKKYIIETTGTGVAIFDYDNDGWPDIFLLNGTQLEGFPKGKAPPVTCIAIPMTESLPTLLQHPASETLDGRRGFALATTTTTAGKMPTSPTTEKTTCITTKKAISSRSRKLPALPAPAKLGVRVAPSSITTEMGTST